MARFDVYANPDADGYLLDVQADLLSHLNTRIVVPLLAKSRAPAAAATLNPVFDIQGQQFVMTTQFMAALPLTLLKMPLLNLESSRNEITRALDFLFQGC